MVVVIYHSKTVLIVVADGCEDIETVCLIDILNRGVKNVTIASVNSTNKITLMKNTKIIADKSIEKCKNIQYDMIVLPGGIPGCYNLSNCKTLIEMLNKQKANNNKIAAICYSPIVVLYANKLIEDNVITSHPSLNPSIINLSEPAKKSL